MYRTNNGIGVGIDARGESFPTFLGFGGLDVKYLQDMYLDAASIISSPSASPTSTCTSSDGAASPLSPIACSTPSPTYVTPPAIAAVTAHHYQQQQQQHSFGNSAATNLMGTSQAALLTQSINSQAPYFLNNHNNTFAATKQQQQLTAAAAYVAQQQYHHQQQQQQQQQRQQQQQQNEISKSLKTFAMLASYKSVNESAQLYPADAPVDAVMQEFANNGYTADDLNCYYKQQLYDSSFFGSGRNSASSNNLNLNIINCSNTSAGSGLSYNGINPYHFNTNYNDLGKPFWMWHLSQQQQQHQHQFLPTTPPARAVPQQQPQHAATATAAATAAAVATAAAAANIDYNSQSTNKRPPKRYSTKSDKFTAVKYCVFCENNNEPEAVVKSHAVRDALGRVLCPKLRTYTCPICQASGDMAHTVKYCPQKPIITMEDAVKAESIRQFKNSMHKYGMKV